MSAESCNGPERASARSKRRSVTRYDLYILAFLRLALIGSAAQEEELVPKTSAPWQ